MRKFLASTIGMYEMLLQILLKKLIILMSMTMVLKKNLPTKKKFIHYGLSHENFYYVIFLDSGQDSGELF